MPLHTRTDECGVTSFRVFGETQSRVTAQLKTTCGFVFSFLWWGAGPSERAGGDWGSTYREINLARPSARYVNLQARLSVWVIDAYPIRTV